MSRKLAIGDIHGCNKTLQTLVYEEIGIKQGDTIYPEKLKSKFMIHGHMPQPLEDILLQQGPVINY